MTYYFCHTYLQRGDRTIDQMVQAARSGKQNIVEGCAASATSAKTEIKLINVAKASLHELLEDYIDYLTEDFVQIVKDATDGRGADIIYDPVGGDTDISSDEDVSASFTDCFSIFVLFKDDESVAFSGYRPTV